MPTRDPVDGLSLVAARKLRALRAVERLRQKDVAQRAGISPRTLGLIEGERRRVSLDDALALCKGLGITLAELLDDADPDDLKAFGL